MSKSVKIKLSNWLDENIPHYFQNKGSLIDLIEVIAEATIPIRGLLERGITSREIEHRMNIPEPTHLSINVYEEEQIHEDILTHGIILQAIKEKGKKYLYIASEEADPVLGEGVFGITIDPVDGSSNVIINRTVGTIVGIHNKQGEMVCAFYVLYGIFTNLVIAINGKVAEFILDTSPYSMSFYHYIFQELIELPNPSRDGIKCMGGDPMNWSTKCIKYQETLIKYKFKNRYSGSFVGDFHAILNYGGIYSYFSLTKPKLRFYYEWLPLAFIAITLGGKFIAIGDSKDPDKIRIIEDFPLLQLHNLRDIHTKTCDGIIGSKKAVDLFLDL
jgi:fructose-1,6-bisphosphatase I